MLNKEGNRELAYLVKIDNVEQHPNADRLDIATVGGWHMIVGRDEFKTGDVAIYFEIDSKLPEVQPFTEMEFLKSKHYKIKSQKIRGVISQGLLIKPEYLNWSCHDDYVIDDKGNKHLTDDETRFLTKVLNVTYSLQYDNKRKSSVDIYKKLMQKHPKLFGNILIKKFYSTKIGKKIIFQLFGAKQWPEWVVKTDEERIQNCPWVLNDIKERWVATEKIDGSSTTFTMKKGLFGKNTFYVCSRNVVFDTPDKPCFYEENIYEKMAEKYHVKEVLEDILKTLNLEWVTIQGETFGKKVQARDYGFNDVDFRAFNFVTSKDGRLGTVEAKNCLAWYGIPFVPVLDTDFKLPATVDEIVKLADGKSEIDGDIREGLVIRSADGKKSFKVVSNEYLLKKG